MWYIVMQEQKNNWFEAIEGSIISFLIPFNYLWNVNKKITLLWKGGRKNRNKEERCGLDRMPH